MSDWNTSGAKLAHKVYPAGPEDKAFIDEKHDQLHQQKRMSWVREPTPFSFPAFVVWRTVPSGSSQDRKLVRKGRVVVDIRGLNKITTPDAHPLPLQSEIIAAIADCPFITTVDAASFFHQWPVAFRDRHKLTVVSHRGQEQYNVATMGYKNAPAYVQRQMDSLLRQHRAYARCYIDDIVIFSKTFDEHMTHLRAVLGLLLKVNITLDPKKSFIGYPSIPLLGQRVDAFGMTTSEEKLDAIKDLKFPPNLHDLEIYVGLTGYMRQYVARYAMKAEPLQRLKTELLRPAPKGGNARTAYTKATTIEPTPELLDAFNEIQAAFSQPTTLRHHDPNRQLYIDIDASKDGIGSMVYHVRGDPLDAEKIKSSRGIEPIMFLSRTLSPAETRYWPTELEVAGLCWIIRKIAPMIRTAKKPPLLFTDHSAAPPIARQTSLMTTSIDKLNTRLVRASQYLSQFDIDYRYKPGKQHVVPDALSRLPTNTHARSYGNELDDLTDVHRLTSNGNDPNDHENVFQKGTSLVAQAAGQSDSSFLPAESSPSRSSNGFLPLGRGRLTTTFSPGLRSSLAHISNPKIHHNSEDDDGVRALFTAARHEGTTHGAYVLAAVHVEMSAEFKDAIRIGYQQDKFFAAILPALHEDKDLSLTPQFVLRDDLVYHVDNVSGRIRLCIPKSMQGELFAQAHDNHFHAGFHRAYERLRGAYYVRKLARRLRRYIYYCRACLIMQTRRVKPFGNLRPIVTTATPFHTITIDIVTALPECQHMDAFMSITDKYSKRVTFAAGRKDWNSAHWADALLDALTDWGVPLAIISDRDSKFLSDLWTGIFKRLQTRLLTTTSWHPQADGQSERSNQTAEIALRFLLAHNANADWLRALLDIRAHMNNSSNDATGCSPNEILYGFRLREGLDLIDMDVRDHDDIVRQRAEYRAEAADALAWAAAKMKLRYDPKHVPLHLQEGDFACIELHRGYKAVTGGLSQKFTSQRMGPYRVIGARGKQAYELDLPASMKIHPVISIEHLVPAPKGKDPFSRNQQPWHPPAIRDGDQYEVDRVDGRRILHRRVQYHIRWKGYDDDPGEWVYEDNVSTELKEAYDKLHPHAVPVVQATKKKGPGRPRKTTPTVGTLMPPAVTTPKRPPRARTIVTPAKPDSTPDDENSSDSESTAFIPTADMPEPVAPTRTTTSEPEPTHTPAANVRQSTRIRRPATKMAEILASR